MRIRNRVFLSALILGTAGITTQILLIREFLNIFQGNELIVGIILGNWLLLTGAGAYAGTKTSEKHASGIFKIASFIPAATILLARTLLPHLLPGGMAAGPLFVLGATTLVLAPYCIASGMLFTLTSIIWKKHSPGREGGVAHGAVSKIYIADTTGSVIGGLAFTFFLLKTLKPLQTAALLGLAMISASSLLKNKKRTSFATTLSAAAIVALLAALLLWNPYLQTSRHLFPKQKLLYQDESPYGRIAVTERENQRTLYENRLPLASTGSVEDREETVHYAMLQLSSPEKVLLIGGAVKGTISEILKYQSVRQVDYVESDASLVSAAEKYFPAFTHQKTNIIISDPRRFLKTAYRRYDAILLDTPPPTTLLLNRYYTKEFFEEAKQALKKEGVLSVPLIPSSNYYSESASMLLSTTYRTLKSVFRNVIAIPGRRVFFIASDAPLNENILQVLENKTLNNRYFTPEYLSAELSRDRKEQLGREIKRSAESAEENTDSRPAAFSYTLKYWLSQFSDNYSFYLFFIAVLLLLYLKQASAKSFALFTTGFGSATAEVIILMAYQSAYGELYKMTGLIIAMFMLGLATGALLRKRFQPVKKQLVLTDAAIAATLAVLPLSLKASFPTAILAHAYFSAVTFLLALAMGLQFALVADSLEKEAETGRAAAETYSADLAGSAAGAILSSILLIPLLGIHGASLSVFVLKLSSSVTLFFAVKK